MLIVFLIYNLCLFQENIFLINQIPKTTFHENDFYPTKPTRNEVAISDVSSLEHGTKLRENRPLHEFGTEDKNEKDLLRIYKTCTIISIFPNLNIFSLHIKYLKVKNRCSYNSLKHNGNNTISLHDPCTELFIWRKYKGSQWDCWKLHYVELNNAIASISSRNRRASIKASKSSPCRTSSMEWVVMPTRWSVTRPWGKL